jgi:hypothetical protein
MVRASASDMAEAARDAAPGARENVASANFGTRRAKQAARAAAS